MSAGAITGATAASSLTAGSGLSSMSPQDFLKVMLSELSHQDPMQPQDTNTMVQELGSIQNIQSQLNLQTSIQSLVLQNQISSAGNLIGKMVVGLDASNNQIHGLVTSVQVRNGAVTLELDTGQALAMDHVTQIANQNGTSSASQTGTPTISPSGA